jgi:hypothetical protein
LRKSAAFRKPQPGCKMSGISRTQSGSLRPIPPGEI